MATLRNPWLAFFLLALTTALLICCSPRSADAQESMARLPEVQCYAVMNSADTLVQIDCVGAVLREPYEALVPPWRVWDALRPVADEWSFNLTWSFV